MKIGVQLHPQATSVNEMRSAWKAADSLGVDSIFVWDHFYPLYGNPEAPHFEAYTLLAAMAADTQHAQIGALVTCFTYRNADLLADMSRTIDHISNGRFILGIGSGWFERDYTEYGYEFGTAIARLRLLEKGIPVIKERLGKLVPGPVNGTIPLMIGGGGEKVTLKITAQHANMHNTFGPAENFAHKMSVLDSWCAEIGRDPREIERTVAIYPKDLENAKAFEEAGAEHLIVMLGNPYDLTAVEKYMGYR